MNPEQLPLRDLHLPDAVGWWPPAPGWWLLVAILLTALGRYLWRAWRAWRLSAARRAALSEYARLSRQYASDGDARALARGLSSLLRRVMLAYAPRHTVAGLTGTEWLSFLDRGLSQSPFTKGPGRHLAWLPYLGRTAAPDADIDALLRIVRERLQTPLPEERA